MRISITMITVFSLVGCGASIPAPNAEFAQAKLDLGRAQESGSSVPEAQLHMRLAQENLDAAKALMGTESKDNQRAASLIARATAEADLALNMARDVHARTQLAEAQAALAKGSPTGAALPAAGATTTTTSTTTTSGANVQRNNP